jgi:nitrate reductase gamma subunit
MTVLHILSYITLLVFVVLVILRMIRIGTAPVHLRWELYPVPHESGPRAKYGGSKMEEVDFWTKKHKSNILGEMKVMLPEIIFLKGVWEYNRKLWTGSFPFHFALYMIFFNIALFIIAAIMTLSGSTIGADQSGINLWIYWATYVISWIATVMGTLGALRMLFLRIVDDGLAKFSTMSHYFNIILIGAFYFTGLMWVALDPNLVENILAYFVGIITFSAMADFPTIAYVHMYIGLFFAFYLPFTHMTHFFTKYFTYHKIRWEDSQVTPGSAMQKRLAQQLTQPVTWSASHIGADGTKNWLDLATWAPFYDKKEDKK